MATWHEIHDFVEGWGRQEHIPDNEIVLSEGIDPTTKIPWRHVQRKQPERTIWASEVARHFPGTNLFTATPDEMEKLYTDLKLLLEKEQAERRAYLEAHPTPPVKFEKITLPKFKDPSLALPDIRKALTSVEKLTTE